MDASSTNERVLTETPTGDQSVDMTATVIQNLVGVGGEIQVVVDEEDLGWHLLGDLDQGAFMAEGDGEWKEGLVASSEIIGGEEGIGERGLSEVEEFLQLVGST